VPAAEHALTSDQYATAGGWTRARSVFVSETLLPVVKEMSGGCPNLEPSSFRQDAQTAPRSVGRDRTESVSDTFKTRRTIPMEARVVRVLAVLSGSTACPRGVRHLIPNIARPRRTYANRCSAFARRCRAAQQSVCLYGLGKSADVTSPVGATTAEFRNARNRGLRVFRVMTKTTRDFLRRADAVCRDAQ